MKENILIISTCKEKLHELEFVKPVEDILKKNKMPFFTRNYREVSESDVERCLKIIICGTSLKDFDYFNNINSFSWLKNFEKPVLGICAGMQILVAIYGGQIFGEGRNVKDKLEIGFVTAVFKKTFFGLVDNVQTYNLHQLGVGKIGKYFEIFATSNEGIQAIKHKEKPIYGVLFHPEVRNKNLILEFVKNG